MKNIKLKKCKNCKGTGMVQIAEGKKGLVACPVCKLEMTVGTLRTFSNEQAICIERLEKENTELKEKAKELLNACIFKARGNVNPSWSELITDIEQFLRKIESKS